MDLLRRYSPYYNFFGDRLTGMTFRWGERLDADPLEGPWPELADVSICNRCSMGCDYCYRASEPTGDIMSVEDYAYVLDQLTDPTWGSVFQVAIGGGEPTEHPHFIQLLEMTRERGIVPNYTTNGQLVTGEIARATSVYCGSVAVSFDPSRPPAARNCVLEAMDMFAYYGLKPNIHYVVSNRTIDRAIEILERGWQEMSTNIGSIIFLMYKPQGRAHGDTLTFESRLRRFLQLVDDNPCSLSIGFDACFVPLLLRHTDVDEHLVDSCEAGFFSIYIDEHLNASPCSFANDSKYTHNLRKTDLKRVWTAEWMSYRRAVLDGCRHVKCPVHAQCRGACPYYHEIKLCEPHN